MTRFRVQRLKRFSLATDTNPPEHPDHLRKDPLPVGREVQGQNGPCPIEAPIRKGQMGGQAFDPGDGQAAA